MWREAQCQGVASGTLPPPAEVGAPAWPALHLADSGPEQGRAGRHPLGLAPSILRMTAPGGTQGRMGVSPPVLGLGFPFKKEKAGLGDLGSSQFPGDSGKRGAQTDGETPGVSLKVVLNDLWTPGSLGGSRCRPHWGAASAPQGNPTVSSEHLHPAQRGQAVCPRSHSWPAARLGPGP